MTKRSVVLSAVCGQYGIEVRKEGVPKSFFVSVLKGRVNILCQGQVLGEGIGVGTVVLRSLIGVGSVSSSSMVCVDVLARVAVTVTYWEMPVQDLRGRLIFLSAPNGHIYCRSS